MASEPKWTRSALDRINNTSVVRNNLLYEYYPIECEPFKEGDKFIKLKLSPGKISDGIIIVGKELYDVSVRDLYRRRINVAKRHAASVDVNVDEPAKRRNPRNTRSIPDTVESRPSELFGSEVSEAADLAWEDQVQTLLYTLHSEEGQELEVSSTSRPRQPDENGAVQDLFSPT